MPETDTEWLTARQAMARLGIGRTLLWKLAKEGRLPSYQIGANRKARYYARCDVERLAHEVRPISAHDGPQDRG